MSTGNWIVQNRPCRWHRVARLTVAQVSQQAGVTPQQVRRLVHLGVVKARRVGRSWDIDPTSVTQAGYVKGKHRQPRPRRVPPVAQSTEADGTYYVREGCVAMEMARICRQLHKQDTATWEFDYERELYQVTCTARPPLSWWRECQQAAVTFLFDRDREWPSRKHGGRRRPDDEE